MGININVSDVIILKKGERIEIKLSINDKNIKKNINKIYALLNIYEDKYDIFINDIPFCYIPDAFDHIIFKNKTIKNNVRIKQCRICRLNSICNGIENNSVFYRNSNVLKPVLTVPNEIVFELSSRCMLECKMCNRKKNKSDLNFKKIIKTIDEAEEMNIKNIRFTGGEPLLYPEIKNIVKYSKEKGFYTIVNSSLICSKFFIKKISEYLDDILVSIHGFDEESEKKITGKNFFNKKISNIIYVLKVVKRVRIGSIITKNLIDNFENYIKIIPDGIKVWELYRPMVDYDFIRYNKEFDIDILWYKKLINKIKKTNTNYKILIANPIPFCIFDDSDIRYFLGAMFDDGYTRIVMDSRGYFKPSYYINKNIGNNIYKSWNNSFLRKITWERKREKKCLNCKWFLKCLSGSRYASYIKNGSYISSDPLLNSL